jgi:hypothetical protein
LVFVIEKIMMNLIAAIGVYCFFEKKPAIKILGGLAGQAALQ